MCVCVCAYACLSMCTCVLLPVCVYACVSVCVCMYLHVCTHTIKYYSYLKRTEILTKVSMVDLVDMILIELYQLPYEKYVWFTYIWKSYMDRKHNGGFKG